MSESKPKKGILKKPSINFQQKNRLKWDEDNIQLTEGQKNSTMKINEPKTPYIHYNQETDEIMTDLQTIPGLNLGSSRETPPAGSLSAVSPSSAHFPDSVKEDWDSEGSEEDEETKEKRRKFAQLRAKHYNMKEALSLGHKLVENEDDVVDDDDDDDNDDKSNFNAFKAKLGKNKSENNSDKNDSSSNNVFMET
ncbi:phosphatase inhibitor 2 [Gigaspora margarita]|uniref:Phosphatase inhibitor 2 n=1 Tax=Gigaspora margarita TaxID=4874 RepID=A0A8H4A9W0_GIGMA|nr:phosphatase inhibitor 2 [Gigaspora margarita]